jgi:hypothetical protein
VLILIPLCSIKSLISSIMQFLKSQSLALLLSVTPLAHAQNPLGNLNPSGAGCVDPAGYLQCYEANTAAYVTCVNNIPNICGSSTAEKAQCLLTCGKVQAASNIGCWLQSCWNQVYSCAYQGTVIEYLVETDLIQSELTLPFYPAPVNAPGRCGRIKSYRAYI